MEKLEKGEVVDHEIGKMVQFIYGISYDVLMEDKEGTIIMCQELVRQQIEEYYKENK